MNTSSLRVCIVVAFVMLFSSACTGPAGPPGPPGPAGPGGGPPYIWVCTPAHYPNVGSNTRADLFIFNGSSTPANVAVNILNKDGVNLSGQTIPGTSPAATYPGQTGSSTVPVAPSNTMIVTWQTPQTFTQPPPGIDQTKVSASVRVTSDQPVVVGTDFQWSGPVPLPCSLLPK